MRGPLGLWPDVDATAWFAHLVALLGVAHARTGNRTGDRSRLGTVDGGENREVPGYVHLGSPLRKALVCVLNGLDLRECRSCGSVPRPRCG